MALLDELQSYTLSELHLFPDHRREQGDFAWYKAFALKLDQLSGRHWLVEDHDRLRANYRLVEGKLDVQDMIKSSVANVDEELLQDEKVVKNLAFLDIVSAKIKYLQGLERKRPLNIKLYAVNPQATTRREQKRFDLYRQIAISEVMAGIEAYLQQKYGEQMQQAAASGDQDTLQQLMQQYAQERKAMTPEEVERYMLREYQDPAEVLANQIISYLDRKLRLKDIFHQGWKHALVTGAEIYKVDIENGKPVVRAVHPARFWYSGGTNIEEADWAVSLELLSMTEVVKRYGDRLDVSKLKKVIEEGGALRDEAIWSEPLVGHLLFESEEDDIASRLPVFHYVWRSLRKVGLLRHLDIATGKVETTFVDNSYKLDPEAGDLDIEWFYIPDVYEVYRIGDYFFGAGRVRRIADVNDPMYAPLPYVGVVVDSESGQPTGVVDRLKPFQYLHTIVLNKLIRILGQDKGRKLLMNIHLIPKKYSVDEWLEMLDQIGVGFFDAKQEGLTYADVNQAVREVDMSHAADIVKLVNLLTFLDRQAGLSVGITEQALGQVSNDQLVGTTKIAVNQTMLVLEPYFALHDLVKQKVALQLVDTARYCYVFENPSDESLAYYLDDLSYGILRIDRASRQLLLESTYGIFPVSDIRTDMLLAQIVQLAQAAMQAGQATLTDVLDVLRSETVTEAIERLRLAEIRSQERVQQLQQAAAEADIERLRQQAQLELAKIKAEGEVALAKERERRQTQLEKERIRAEARKQEQEARSIPEQVSRERELDLRAAELAAEQQARQLQAELDRQRLDLERQKLQQQALKQVVQQQAK